MCSGRWALALLAASVGTLSAQDVPRLQARADSLLREWRRASAVADMVDSHGAGAAPLAEDRKSTRLNSSHGYISYAVFCLKKKQNTAHSTSPAPPSVDSTSCSTQR